MELVIILQSFEWIIVRAIIKFGEGISVGEAYSNSTDKKYRKKLRVYELKFIFVLLTFITINMAKRILLIVFLKMQFEETFALKVNYYGDIGWYLLLAAFLTCSFCTLINCLKLSLNKKEIDA